MQAIKALSTELAAVAVLFRHCWMMFNSVTLTNAAQCQLSCLTQQA
jgi:hypothetical protein